MSIARHAVYNLAASVVPIVTSLLILPIYIHTIGEARYGMVALIGALVGYFGVFDLGLSAAATQRIASTPADQKDERRRVFWTAVAINGGLGMLGGLVILPVAHYYVAYGLHIEAGLFDEIQTSVWWLALALPVAQVNGVLRGSLAGANRFLELNVINVVVGTLSQFVPLAVALWVSPQLTWVLPALYFTRLLNLACYGWVLARKVFGGWQPAFDRSRAKDLLSFGGWITITDLVSPLMTSLDRYLIGSMVGLGAVSYYTVPFQLAERTQLVPQALVAAAFPRVAAGSPEERAALGARNLKVIAALMLPPMVFGMVALHPFLTLWIGARFAENSALCGQILLIGFWWNALGTGAFSWLYAVGKAKAVTLIHLMEAIPYFVVLFAALRLFGMEGAAVAFSLRVSVDALLLAWRAGLLGVFARISLVAALIFAAAVAFRLPGGWPTALQAAGAALPVAASCAVALLLLRGEWGTVRAILRR